MLVTRDLSVLGGGIEAGMPQVLLQQAEAVARIVKLHGVNSKGIAQFVWSSKVKLTGIRVSKLW